MLHGYKVVEVEGGGLTFFQKKSMVLEEWWEKIKSMDYYDCYAYSLIRGFVSILILAFIY